MYRDENSEIAKVILIVTLFNYFATEFEGHLCFGHGGQSLILPPQSSCHLHEGHFNVCVVLSRGLNGVQHVFGGCVTLGLIIGDLPQFGLACDCILLCTNQHHQSIWA